MEEESNVEERGAVFHVVEALKFVHHVALRGVIVVLKIRNGVFRQLSPEARRFIHRHGWW